MSGKRVKQIRIGLVLAALAAILKLGLMAWTEGTVDLFLFRSFGRLAAAEGWEGVGRTSAYWNHPPPIWFLSGAVWALDAGQGIPFGWVWRLMAVLADLALVVGLLWWSAREDRVAPGVLVLAASPLSILVSGYHGNTDAILAAFLVAACVVAGLRERGAWGAGVLVGLALWVKVAAVLPAALLTVWFFRCGRRSLAWFCIAGALTVAIGWFPLVFAPLRVALQSVGYAGSMSGTWGFTFLMEALGGATFASGPEGAGAAGVVQFLKWAAAAVFLLSGVHVLRRGGSPVEAVAVGWCGLLFLAPSAGVQYSIWVQPFLLLAAVRTGVVFAVAATLWAAAFYWVSLFNSGGAIISMPLSEYNRYWIPFGLAVWGVCGAAWVRGLLQRRPERADPGAAEPGGGGRAGEAAA